MVMNEPGSWTMPLDCLLHGFNGQFFGYATTHGFVDDFFVEQVFDGCKVKPAFTCVNVAGV
jgi:hypothetical protein